MHTWTYLLRSYSCGYYDGYDSYPSHYCCDVEKQCNAVVALSSFGVMVVPSLCDQTYDAVNHICMG